MQWPVWRVAVAEQSMEPALRHGDWLLVWRGVTRGKGRRPLRIKAGQLVIARHPARPELLLVKRAAWREPDGWWLSSDNPWAGAVDSARFGLVAPDLIEGRMLLRYWPVRPSWLKNGTGPVAGEGDGASY
jgi:nickel-type superoxide dismutase maturation protease